MSVPASGDTLDARPHPKEPRRLGIGLVGSGNIVENAHVPSYQVAGFRVAAITSRTEANARRVAAAKGIERVHRSVEDLAYDPEVDIVDIALPPDLQPPVVMQAIGAGKHVLAQKPLAVTYRDALAMVEAAERASVMLAVNQNGRWDPSINAARRLITEGMLGTRLLASMTMHITMPWQEYYKDPRYERLMILHMSVHHIDQMRVLFGNPANVWAHTRKTPGQEQFGETIAQYALIYEDGFVASSLDDGVNWSTDFGITYRIQGTDAVMLGEIGWPRLTHSTLKVQRKGEDEWTEPKFSRMWFPDAFSATMGELMCAVEEGREPSNSGRDNLGTMRAVMAAYRSIEEKRVVGLEEISAERD
jgi:predicted dehydrogenase